MPPSPVSKRGTFKQTFAQALALPLKAVWNEFERIYSEVLTHRADHFDALQMLSVIKLAKGQPAETLRLSALGRMPRRSAAAIKRSR